jgi:hypothetical protein
MWDTNTSESQENFLLRRLIKGPSLHVAQDWWVKPLGAWFLTPKQKRSVDMSKPSG